MDTPEQCRTCRHAVIEKEEARCKKRMVQHCERGEHIQKMMLMPGYCSLLNPNNDCAEYARPWFGKGQ